MSKVFYAILIMAIVTYIPRVLPIAIFKKKIESKVIKSFLFYVPYAVLGAMTFPGIFYIKAGLLPAIGGTILALVLAYFEQGLMKVAVGAVAMVYIISAIINW